MTTSKTRAARRGARAAARHRLAVGVFVGMFGLHASACSDSGSDNNTTGGDSPDAGSPDASTGDPSILVGTFQVRLVPPVPASGSTPETPGYTAVVGKVYDGPTPSQIIWEEGTKEGTCQLFTPRVPFCSTPCGGSAVCVEDETCKDYPSAHSAGQVTAKGLRTKSGETTFTMSPIANSYQPPAGVQLAYPAFDEGGEITLEASGDYFSAFTLKASGISPLVLESDMIVLSPNQPVQLKWTPPAKAEISSIHVKLDISHHGGTKGMIECDSEDTGSLELPASLLTELLNLGAAGFPSIIITRKAVGATTIAPGRVDVIVSSEVEHAVQIPGLTSCTEDTDCPSGQTCQSDLTCQ